MSFLGLVPRTLSKLGRAPSLRQGARVRSFIRTSRTIGFVALAAAACADPGVTAIARADSDFDIQIRYWPGTEPDSARAELIEAAAARWERLLRSGLRDVYVDGDAGCGQGSPPLDETVDDVVVYVRFVELDVLAEAGPCLVRSDGGLPVTGTVWLDGPGRVGQLAPEALAGLVTHELGHVLGFGALWPARRLIRDPSLGGGEDPHFVGPRARSAFDAVGGSQYRYGAKVPVDDSGLEGTADRHWRLRLFEEEIMTSTIFSTGNPLSRVTAAAMADLGYDVDLDGADAWTLPIARSVIPRERAASVGSRVALEITERTPRWRIRTTDGGRPTDRDRPR